MLDGAVSRQERQDRFHAVMTANLLNCWIKKPVSAERLLGIEEPKRKGYASASSAEREAMVQELLKRQARRAGKESRQ
jgi:hypothetical protein